MSNWKLGQDSYHKLVVWFADGNVRTLYSIDWRSKFSASRDMNLGLARLHKRIAEWGAKALVAEIYQNNYGSKTGQAVERYESGIKTEIIRK